MKNTAVKYGVYAFIITIIWTIIEHILGYNTTNHETGQYARMVGAFVYWIMIIVAIFSTRKEQGGLLTVGQGLKVAATIALIYSLGVTILYCLYGEVINTQFKPTLMAFERAKLEAAHATPDAIAAKMKQVDMQTGGSVVSYLFLFAFMFVGGMAIGLITSLIMKRSKKG
ncbi:MAG: hypothetical protein JWQ30_501 [Sediminibacterium sp.]|nr:hypothetical protein [Sediminibacterium sp.]